MGGRSAPGVCVIGAGLAGCEAAWQIARRGVDVALLEMKPVRFSPAHRSRDFAELVYSNSLRAASISYAAGLLKEEMRRLGSLVMAAADECSVPAGRALAVDRVAFARRITDAVESHPRIRVQHRVVERVPDDGLAIVASGPLTLAPLARDLAALLGEEYLYFYDALSPILYADSIDPEPAFRASRWEEDEGDYLNLPLDEARYHAFVAALLAADTVPLHPFEAELYFEGCLPIEEMARRGPETLAHGPMKPVGLVDPRTGRRPYAVVQLRQEDKRGVLYNIVGFQTKLRIGEQQRILRTLPGLADAAFSRFGSVHRNTYLNSPRCLLPTLEARARPGLYLAGQIAGVEGYVESAALGLLAGIHAARASLGLPPELPPETTAHGSLLGHVQAGDPRVRGEPGPARERGAGFQPMNATFGLFPPLPAAQALGRRERHERLARRALADLAGYAERVAPRSAG